MLSPEFKAKHFVSKCSVVKRFVHAHLLVYQMGTPKLQCKPKEVEDKATDYTPLMCQIVKGPHRNWRFILNMDQMLVYITMSAAQTLEVVRRKTVHICTSINNKKHATVAVTIMGDGTVLQLVIVIKGQPNSRIANSEFATNPTAHRYCCQKAAWMDKAVMIAWVEEVLKPYAELAPANVIPLHILDS
jgi:hypothetical protein